MIRAPFFLSSRSSGTRWMLLTNGFLPHIRIVRLLRRSNQSWASTIPKSASWAASPAPEQMSPDLIATGPILSKK